MKKNLLLSFTLLICVLFVNADPCDSIITIHCDSSYTFSKSGVGDSLYQNGFSNGCNNNWLFGGKEQIYEFIPTLTGSYEFILTSATGGQVEYLIKNAGSGCNNIGWNTQVGWNIDWNCLGVFDNSNFGSLTSRTLIASTTYYILLNAEDIIQTTQTFNIICARVACDSIQPITCDSLIHFAPLTGYGDYEFPNGFSNGCNNNWLLGGKEQIYQFTPADTGSYATHDPAG